MLVLAVLAALVAGAPGAARATESPVAWRVAKEVDGITVWSAETRNDFWGYARGRVEATPAAIFHRVSDFEALPRMFPTLDRVEVLRRDASSALVWFHYDLPWPLSDREYTAQHRWWTEPSGTIVLDVEGANDLGPPPDGAVEVERVLTRIVMAPLDGGTASDVEYLFRADMAGMLPRAVRSQTAWKIPLNVMLSMRRSLAPSFAAR
jgi:hypothetical protein